MPENTGFDKQKQQELVNNAGIWGQIANWIGSIGINFHFGSTPHLSREQAQQLAQKTATSVLSAISPSDQSRIFNDIKQRSIMFVQNSSQLWDAEERARVIDGIAKDATDTYGVLWRIYAWFAFKSDASSTTEYPALNRYYMEQVIAPCLTAFQISFQNIINGLSGQGVQTTPVTPPPTVTIPPVTTVPGGTSGLVQSASFSTSSILLIAAIIGSIIFIVTRRS